jgi:hypothetical protein
LRLQDPSNEVMRQLRFSDNIDSLLEQDIIESIKKKKRIASQQSSDPENFFLNSLNEQEYHYFVETRSSTKWEASGLYKEFAHVDRIDEILHEQA